MTNNQSVSYNPVPHYPRWQKHALEHALKTRRVVILAGPRQCGKTTLVKEMMVPGVEFRTLDDPAMQQAAEIDPVGFVQHKGKTLIIDEIQRVPKLLVAIKKQVDEHSGMGQYLLTGSANIQAIPGAMESLAGRVRKIRLCPLTQAEIHKNPPLFLQHAFDQVFLPQAQSVYREQIINIAFGGGFPEPVLRLLKPEEKMEWYDDYMEALLDRDLKDIVKIQRSQAMRELIGVCAAWSSKLMDFSSIQSGLSIQRSTLETYINALEALYIVERLRPWTNTDYARVGKQSKLFMTDCGLMCSILRWSHDQIAFDLDRSGKLIETFVYNELSALVHVDQQDYQLFHYRDREQREIDFLIERSDGSLLGIEVKAGSALGRHDFKHLQWFKDRLVCKKPFIGIVLYAGEHVAPFGKDMWAVPISALWGC